MARKRVQVGRLRSPDQLQAVARPVETYVRPAEVPVQESELGAFVRAVAPGVKTLADVQKQEALKKNREIEKGNATRRAYDAKIALGQANRAAAQDYIDNEEEYLTLSPEEVASRRQGIFQPFLDKAIASGDELLVTAVQNDMEVANLDFFTRVYDPARQKYQDGLDLEELGTEVLAVARSINLDPQSPEEEMAALGGYQAIDDLVNSMHMATGISKRRINEYILTNLYAPSAKFEGKNGLYNWLSGRNEGGVNVLNTGWAAKPMKTINNDIATFEKNQLKATEDAEFQQFLFGNIQTFLEDGQFASLGVDGEFTSRSGKKYTASKKDIVKAFEAAYGIPTDSFDIMNPDHVQLVLNPDAVNFYGTMGVAPTAITNSIRSGSSMLNAGGGNLGDPDAVKRGENAIRAYQTATRYGFDTGLTGDEKTRFKVADILMTALSDDAKTALTKLQNADFTSVKNGVVTLSQKNYNDLYDDNWWGKSPLNKVTNTDLVRNRTRELAGAIQATTQVSMEVALNLAKEEVLKDAAIFTNSNGTTSAVFLYDTKFNVQGNEQMGADAYLSAVWDVLSQRINMDDLGVDGITLTNTSNDNTLSLMTVDENGVPIHAIDTINLSAIQDPQVFANTLALSIEADTAGGQGDVTKEPTFDTLPMEEPPEVDPFKVVQPEPEPVEIPGISEAEEQLLEDVSTAQAGVQATAQARIDELLDRARFARDNPPPPKEEVPVGQAEEQLMDDVATAQAGVRDFAQAEIDEMKQRVLRNKAIKEMEGTDEQKESIYDTIMGFLFGDTSEASQSDLAGDTENMQGTTTASKAVNLIKSQEGFEAQPYKDGKNRSVGYGFYLPSLAEDEKALIKDVENITKEEADAVLELKVQKIETFLNKELPDISSLSDEAQAGVMSMAFQLGAENVKTKFPTFFKNLKAATEAPAGSDERMQFLKVASDNMIYNFKNGKQVGKTLWHQQTPNRALAMAALVAQG